MKTSLLVGFAVLFSAASGQGQWFGRTSNTVGNWTAFSDNRGIVLNNGQVGGASWKGTNLVFGAGLWIGGLVDCPFCKRAPVAVTVSFDPNSGASDFVGGSAIYDGDLPDTTGIGISKYLPQRSTAVSPSQWPIRTTGADGLYVDDVELRATTGLASYIGNEDIFTVYKNTDSAVRDLKENLEPVPRFEVRTQMGFWGTGVGRDVIVVRNQLIYLGTDTLLDPTVALAIDGDIGNGSAAASNAMRGFLDSGVQGCLFRSDPEIEPAAPLLGVYVLRGTSGTGMTDRGITTLRRWTIQNDPITSAARFDFMTASILNVIDSGQTGDMRALLASTSQTRLLPGDTMYFDYAIGAVDASGSSSLDTEHVIEVGRMLTSLYKTGSLGTLSVRSAPQPTVGYVVRPNPAGRSCTIVSGAAPIRRIELLNVLGEVVRTVVREGGSDSITIDLDGLSGGMYYARVNGGQALKILKLR